jgi:hypothetical protein
LAKSAAVGTPHLANSSPPDIIDIGPAALFSISPSGELQIWSLQRACWSGVRLKKLNRFRAGATGVTGTPGTGGAAMSGT